MSETPEFIHPTLTIRNGDNHTVASKLRTLADAIDGCDEECGLVIDGIGAGVMGLTLTVPMEMERLFPGLETP